MMATAAYKTTAKKTHVKDVVKEIIKYPREEALALPRSSMPKILAHCLDWCARECPKQFLPLNLLVKAVSGQRAMPNPRSKEVEQLRHKWTPVRKILMGVYKRDLVVERGIGVRATDGSEDVASTTLGRKVRRFEGAQKAVETTLTIVDTSQIKDKELKAWVGALNPAFKMLSSPDFMKKLARPKDGSPVEEKKK